MVEQKTRFQRQRQMIDFKTKNGEKVRLTRVEKEQDHPGNVMFLTDIMCAKDEAEVNMEGLSDKDQSQLEGKRPELAGQHLYVQRVNYEIKGGFLPDSQRRTVRTRLISNATNRQEFLSLLKQDYTWASTLKIRHPKSRFKNSAPLSTLLRFNKFSYWIAA